MGDDRLEVVRRDGFDDGRDGMPRVEVCWHPTEGAIVLGVWRGPVCRVPHQSPIEDAPRLIGELADSAATSRGTSPRMTPGSPAASRRPRILERLGRPVRRNRRYRGTSEVPPHEKPLLVVR